MQTTRMLAAMSDSATPANVHSNTQREKMREREAEIERERERE
jgi:hypothetical protein